jgi:fructose-1,6-bisphosphatase I
MNRHPIPLFRHFLMGVRRPGGMTRDLAALLNQLGFAAKFLAREVGTAALEGRLGFAGDVNATGDAQKKLDVLGNEAMLDAVADTGLVSAYLSEECDEILMLTEGAPYIFVTDPLDGSSNTDINGAVGTIFGVYSSPHPATPEKVLEAIALPPVAAGYVFYGTSTIFIYTTGQEVTGFTLDRDFGEFLLSHENIRCPERGIFFSANAARLREWSPGLQAYVQYVTQRDKPTGRPYSLRYSGALVADLHRCLVEGGLYLYPGDAQNPDGKLRLVYECAPLAFVVESAGGRASCGNGRTLELRARKLHQKCPVYIGSAGEVALLEKFLQEEKQGARS